MATQDGLESALAELLEAQATNERALSSARYALINAMDERRRERAQSAAANPEFFTEKEFAERLKVSVDTVQRARQKGLITPVTVMGCIRYSSVQLAQVASGEISLTPARQTRKRAVRVA